jgi:hypothetical protein
MNVTMFPVAEGFSLVAVSYWFTFFDNAVSPAAVQQVGWVLLHFLWQGATAAALLVVALRLLQRQSAKVRY